MRKNWQHAAEWCMEGNTFVPLLACTPNIQIFAILDQ